MTRNDRQAPVRRGKILFADAAQKAWFRQNKAKSFTVHEHEVAVLPTLSKLYVDAFDYPRQYQVDN